MTEKQEELFKCLNQINNRIKIFSGKDKIFDLPNRTWWTSEEYLYNLINHLDAELTWVSNLFNLPKISSLVLSTVIRLYLKHKGVKTNFITYGDIESELYLHIDNNFVFELREPIFDLEERNIINISDAGHYFIRVFNEADRRESDYFMIPAKPTFVPFGNKKFELTNSFINKLNFL